MVMGFVLFSAIQLLLSRLPSRRCAKGERGSWPSSADPCLGADAAQSPIAVECGALLARRASVLAAATPQASVWWAPVWLLGAAAALFTAGALLLAPPERHVDAGQSSAGAQEPEASPSAVVGAWPSAGALSGRLAWGAGADLAAASGHRGGAADSAAGEPAAANASARRAWEVEPPAGGPAIRLKLQRQHMPVQVVGDVVYHRSAYVGTIYVGTPATPFGVVFDTGSGHLILPSTYCHSEVCRARRRFRRSSSQSARDINCDGTPVQPRELRDQITISFGTGEVSGVFMEDTLCTADPGPQPGAAQGGLPPGCVTMRLIAATSMSEDPFADFDFDGVLGLGLGGLSQTPLFNFLDVVAGRAGREGRAGDLAHTFGVFLAPGDGAEAEADSEITFGGYDRARLDGELAWNSVDEPQLGQWMIRVRALRVDGERVGFCAEGCRAILDTGTSLLTVPTDAFAELFDRLKHPSASGRDCRGAGPRLHFELEGITLTLGPPDYAHFDPLEDTGQTPADAGPAVATPLGSAGCATGSGRGQMRGGPRTRRTPTTAGPC